MHSAASWKTQNVLNLRRNWLKEWLTTSSNLAEITIPEAPCSWGWGSTVSAPRAHHDHALTNAICFYASQTSINPQDNCYPWQKVLGSHPVITPIFSFSFYQKKPIKLPSGPDHLVKPCIVSHQRRDHCIVGDLISLVGTSCQQHVPSSSICGSLKGLSPYLLTRDPRISCVTTCHLLSSVVRTRGPKTKHTIFACHHS